MTVRDLMRDEALRGRIDPERYVTETVGLPTLRLIRVAIGPYSLDGLAPGQWRDVAIH